jgi:phosphoribosyl 1,2-cyclic phosphodiesterase
LFQAAVIVSGSKGNAVLVRSSEGALLLDAGVSGRTIISALASLKVDPREIRAVLVSHEHSDHISGVGVIARALKIPVYINWDTYLRCTARLGKLPLPPVHFETGTSFTVADIWVHPFRSPHDAVDSCNFTFLRKGDPERKLGVATDLGYPTALALQKLKKCSTLILESNHDEHMLMNGPYDWHLKQRIKSDFGHLSNLQAVGVVGQVAQHGLKNLILAHLSEINNDPAIARDTMRDFLKTIRGDIRLIIASQYAPTPLIEI